MKRIIITSLSAFLLSSSMASMAWNLPAKNINALQFERNGTIQFTLFDTGTDGAEYICDEFEGGGPWFVIKSCKIGKGKGNKSASPSCLASVGRMADMLLEAKVDGIPVHLEADGCVVTETALKPLPVEEPEEEVVL